jgi:hypothetical protein
MRTSFLNASWRAASFVLAAFLFTAARVEAAPVVNMYFSPASIPQGGTTTLVISVSDDLNGGFTGGTIASWSYPSGVVNASPSVFYDDCLGAVATPGAGGMSASGMTLAAFGTCYIEIYVTSSTAGTYTAVFPAGGLTASTGSNAGAPTAPLDVIAPNVVTTTADSGPGSLRQAIIDSNASCAAGSSIAFNIPGAGPHTIQPLTALDTLSCDSLPLDGYTQSGAIRNSDTGGGNNASIQVVLDGSLCPGCTGLNASAYVLISGLAIHSFAGVAIQLNATAYVNGNYLGTDAGGMAALPNLKGVNVTGGSAYVGSTNPGDRNLISGNSDAGIMVWNSAAAQITNNQIGGRRDGSAGMPNATGVYFNGANYSRSYVEGNFIRYNTAQGVVVDDASLQPVIFTLNAMSGNGGIGIDLNNDGPTLNDETGPPYDTDGGPDRLMNYPVVTSVTHSGSDTVVQGYIKSEANSNVQVQLFDNLSLPSNTEGAIPLTSFSVSLDVNGLGSFTYTVPGYLASYVSAAATTDDCNDGCVYSSEYSPAVGLATPITCSMYVQISAVGDAGVIGAPSVIVPPGATAIIQPLCTEQPTSTVWNTTETTTRITVTAPAAGASATYTVDVTSKSGSGTFSVTLVGAAVGTPLCTIAPSVTLPLDPLDTSPFNVNSSCSPAASGFTWNSGFVNLVSGQGTATATYQMSGGGTAGYGYTVTLTPTDAAGEGPTATRIIWIGAVHLDTTPLAFPTTPVGSQSAPQSVTVQNLSDYYQPSLTISVTGPFVATNDCPVPMPTVTNCTVNVSYAPTVPGAGQTGTLTVSYGFPGNPSYSIALSGSSTGAPVVTLTPNPASLTFAARTVSTTSAPQTVTVANTGSLPLAISSITITGDFAYTSACPPSLAAGASCTIDVTFTPLVPGARAGMLTINDNAAGSPHAVALNGTGLSTSAAVADVSPAALDFPPQPVGTDSAAQPVTVTNSGTAPLTFSSILASGDYAVASLGTAADPAECPLTLAPGESCQIGVVFRPTGFNLRTGDLTIVTNAGTTTVRLVGTGLVLAPPQLSVPTGLEFGSQPIGTRSSGRALAISNTSINLATITELSTTGDFSVSDTCATIAAGATCSPLVFFRPTLLGPRAGTLTIRTLRDANPYTVVLTGTGAENRVPVLEVSATRLGFGNAFIGMPVTLEVTLRNVGQAPLTVTGFAFSGDFFADAPCVTTISPSASCTVHVTFVPSSPGRQAGVMEIHSDAADSPHPVDLGGTGCFLPSPSRARFGILLCGS